MNNMRNVNRKHHKKMIFICFIILSFNGFSQVLFPFTNQMTGKIGFMDESSKIIIKPNFDEVSPFYDGIAIARDGMENHYINSLGQKIFKDPYKIDNFSCGYGLVKTREGYFFIDKTGKVVSPKYQHAKSFSDDKAIIFKENRFFVINKSFQILFEIENDPSNSGEYFGYYNDGLMPIKNIKDEWGYLDSDGKLSLKPSYSYPGKFYNGHAIVLDKAGKCMLINKMGETIYEFKMERNYTIPNSLVFKDKLIYTKGRGNIHIVSLLDKSEKVVIVSELSKYDHSEIGPKIVENYIFYDGKALDLDGNVIWQLDKFKGIKSILYEKYLLLEKSNDDVHLYKFDGSEIIFP